MKRFLISILLAGLSLGVFAKPSFCEIPQPAATPKLWQLDIEYKAPLPIKVTLPGEKPAIYWYMIYKVTNHTNADQLFVPEFLLYTGTGQMLRSGQGVPPGVFSAIQKVSNNPLLRDAVAMTGKLLVGDDNSKTGVAIWQDFDVKAGEFDVFIGGLSGETTELNLPTPIEVVVLDNDGNKKTVTKQTVVLAKTMQLTYKVAGEAASRASALAQLVKQNWVMR
ncbi:MAG: hypothetical protein EHM48_05545 [Planctomycetaceae bacterium]|nr:MAG: hypothetical protein EHM48_05545 [Planctomycetaceae bacterium]